MTVRAWMLDFFVFLVICDRAIGVLGFWVWFCSFSKVLRRVIKRIFVFAFAWLLTPQVTLWSYWRSSCSWRVRIALAYKNIEYEYKAVHLVKNGGEQFDPSYTKLNPGAKLPTLEIDDHVLYQSMAILEYLEATRKEHPLLPESPAEAAHVRALCMIVVADTQPIQNLGVITHPMIGENKMEWMRIWIEKGLQAFELALKQSNLTGSTRCVGNEITLADVCLVPQIYNARRAKVDLTQFPIMMGIEKALLEEPCFQVSAPERMPDAQV